MVCEPFSGSYGKAIPTFPPVSRLLVTMTSARAYVLLAYWEKRAFFSRPPAPLLAFFALAPWLGSPARLAPLVQRSPPGRAPGGSAELLWLGAGGGASKKKLGKLLRRACARRRPRKNRGCEIAAASGRGYLLPREKPFKPGRLGPAQGGTDLTFCVCKYKDESEVESEWHP